MTKNNILTLSADGKQEYCCNIVKINELIPIEGSDFLAQTYINGESIVVRKDQVHTGEVYFYASNECELNSKFLSANNLYDASTWELNNNADEVRPIKNEIEKQKKNLAKLKKKFTDFTKIRRCFETVNEEIKEREITKGKNLLKRYVVKSNEIDSYDLMRVLQVINDVKQEIIVTENLIEKLRKDIKTKVGFFNKYGRVKCIKLKGIPSYGFIFRKDELEKAYPEIADVNLEENIGLDFDTIGEELFVKAYIPRVKISPKRAASTKKATKKVEKMDRMIKGEFNFHYDTNPLGKNMDKFNPDDTVAISIKIHGSSFCMSNCKVKFPINLPIHKKIINFVSTKVFKKNEVFPSYYVDYDEVYSSRKVIKNKDLNPLCKQGYYSKDIWGYWAERLKGILPKGYSLYAEIAGYEPGCDERMIQPEYDYGCEPGYCKFMPYRIHIHNEDGTHYEYNVDEVYNWTIDLMTNHPELEKDIMPIDILYHGKLRNLYPKIPVNNLYEWRNAILMEMQNDTETFGMELDEPLCKNNVPREGFVIRKDNDGVPEAWKCKCSNFKQWERKKVDEGIIDIEMTEAYSEEINEENIEENNE